MNGQMKMMYEEFIAYNNELSTYVDIEKFRSSSKIIEEILNASKSIKLKHTLFDDVDEYRREENHEINLNTTNIVNGFDEFSAITNNVEITNEEIIREEIKIEFYAVNKIIKDKFRDSTSQTNTIQSCYNLIQYTINKLIKKYENSTYKFNYSVVTNITDNDDPNSIRNIELILLNE